MPAYREVNKELIELAQQRKTGKEISRILNMDYSTVHAKLRKLGIHLYNYHNELKFDNTVFDSINTEEKAYWLGFLFADGCVRSNTNSVELDLKGSDIQHLRKYNAFLKNKKAVVTDLASCQGKVFPRCRVIVTDKHFHDTLVSLGCVPNKSLILKFPDLSIFKSEDLVRHFIRGYVDGDGCITHSHNHKLVIEIIGTKDFLSKIMELYPTLFVSIRNSKQWTEYTYYTKNGGRKAVEFGSILYDNSTIYLQRKYDKFQELRNG